MRNENLTLKQTALTGVMAAAVYVASAYLQIPVPTAIDNTRIHMGNVMCLLSGLLLGPVQGGFASGIGSMFFDLTNPAYLTSAPFTFVFKFIMAWICGKIAWGSRLPVQAVYRDLAGAAAGSLAYLLLYLLKSFVEQRYVLSIPLEAVILTTFQKAVVSAVNGVVAVAVAVPLGSLLKPAIRK